MTGESPKKPAARRALQAVGALALPSLLLAGAPGDTMVVHPGEGKAWILEWQGKSYPCAIGKHGVIPADAKREGDGCTPLGTFHLRCLYYRADRLPKGKPATGLQVTALSKDDGWCDAPGDPAYNHAVKLPFAPSHEELWREKDALYDLIVPIGYNDEPVVPGRGSAIFLHIASPAYGPTAGCVAVSKEDLLEILTSVGPASRITILAAKP
ncbi:MAG TPA: L,D-transpeptidase family protein [Holophaga sp.]|nr:L,D-transpeptidase family protein [Holophaga sp.]